MALLSAVRCLSVMATVGVCLWGLTVTMTGAGRGGELSWQWAQPTGCDSNLYWYSVAFASFVTAWHVLYSAFLCSCCCTTILALMFPSSGYTQMDDLERQQQADGPQQEIVA
uniref:Uncharacterized protein n=1 Tax=Chromera velia CCMP2878 TaxID=1169474 RepID=A0A0G4G945_9ALVE|eukprot:Cvel_20804.t1-p1 / transcript=Cvel_20804.t1 / gene=Cvel_20804 / organism=Chromera_velia_CCMP2878 / gene_product=hypothetical protein / transcript_product=hypothetical protein / location=Cvel_scaffold1900:26840-27669(-) / protein_length=111 / sequence_SO=supercontig / SO=protein_coding / is_pseudo=false